MKKVLMISPVFYGYSKQIIQALERRNMSVSFCSESTLYSNLFYIFLLQFRKFKFVESIIDSYFKRRITYNNDIVLVIRGNYLSRRIVSVIKERNPHARLILYSWDSVFSNDNFLNIAPEFDDVLVFDKEDAERYGWVYRPMFYYGVSNDEVSRDIDISFICALHTKRAKIGEWLEEFSKENGLNVFIYIFARPLSYFKRKYIIKDMNYLEIKVTKLKFIRIPEERTQSIFERSKVLFDYAHPDQKGFTTRSIESVGHRCKLITNNKAIKSADFYNENNVYIYDEKEMNIPSAFFEIPYQELPENVYNYYSLEGWLDSVLKGVCA